jgi:hypothetical protein
MIMILNFALFLELNHGVIYRLLKLANSIEAFEGLPN